MVAQNIGMKWYNKDVSLFHRDLVRDEDHAGPIR